MSGGGDRDAADREQASRLGMFVARETMGTAMEQAHGSIISIKNYVQKGPDGIGWLCFVGGGLTTLFGVLGIFNFFAALLEPIDYVIHVYEMVFGLVTCVLEAPADWVEQNQKLRRAQQFIEEFARFLTTLGGRGLFYLFQGSLTYSTEAVSVTTALSLYMCFCGVVCIGMQYGFVPGDVQKQPTTQVHGDYIHVVA